MKVYVSEELQQSFLEVRRKQIISVKEFLRLKTRISKNSKWLTYVDFFMDLLMTCGIFLIVNSVTLKFEINLGLISKMIITEVILSIHKLFWYIYGLISLFKLLKEDGIKISEVENFKDSKINETFQAYNLLRIVNLFYSDKIRKEIFQPIAADWQEEYFEALFKKEIWKARWINVRYTYAFLVAMWQKSPIGDLIEFFSKIAK